jgi:hypothetical protein
MKKKIGSVLRNLPVLSVFLLIFFAFLVNTFHTQFSDEFDNIYGGFLINQRILPYTGFFTHHNPGAYYLASIITLFTQRSFVHFREIFAVILFLGFVASFLLLRKRLQGENLNFFLYYGILIGAGATFWWGHMLLSETVVGYLLVPAFLLIFIKKLKRMKFDLIDVWTISVLTFFALFTSLTYVYLIPVVDTVVLYFYFENNRQFEIIKILKPISIFILPYALFLIYLILTGSIYEFYFSSIDYNVAYYIYNFPQVAGSYSHHPLRYAISIAKNTADQFYAILVQAKDFNFSYPLTISLALADMGFLIYLSLRRQYLLILMVIWTIFFVNARSTPLTIGETDFHATVYIMLSIAIASFLLFRLKEELGGKLPYLEKLIFSFIFLILGIYWLSTTAHLTLKFVDKGYKKLMATEPMIYDYSQAAPVINKLVDNNDYYWIGPFELQELLFIKGKPASKYYWFLPANARDEKIKREIISDLNKNRPKVILFKKDWSTFGVSPADFNKVIVDFLNENYFQIADLKKDGLKIRFTQARERDFNFETELFFDNSRKNVIIQELFEKGLIEKI